ncbi:NAD(P)H-hydrate dehydratase [Antarcticimicrobium luteum]|uniref:Bifunctional NAD(P)H-hydrate repair enzyme n=1 Tax=Antarcticimicrobium luteum TaxID=2547397 RepID=A0A4V3ASN9_9RHOB|nr:NAD(P)H-hydrate dehydratase [Antarcticimicrobium luteum]
MTEVLTAAGMRAIERAAIDSGAVTGLELMERAGQGVVAALFAQWPHLAQGGFRAVVLCGPGNNGGDGFVVARLLRGWGWEVELFLLGDPAALSPDTRANYQRWRALGAVRPLAEFRPETAAAQPAGGAGAAAGRTWIIDALFGTGLSRPLEGALAERLSPLAAAELGARPGVIAVDVPSGLCADSGQVLGLAVPADLTVSFHRAKRGHYLAAGPRICGALVVAGIGLEGGARRRSGGARVPGDEGAGGSGEAARGPIPEPPGVRLAAPDLARLSKAAGHHKYAHGHALILSGGAGRTGAARLAARGALRIGAGLVTLGVPPGAQQEVACQITAPMLRRVADSAGLSRVLEDARLNALCLGPGLGLDRARDLVPAALETGRAAVLDADALTGFAEEPERLFGLLHDTCVLTPHDGEFARLFPDLAKRLNAPATRGPAWSRVEAARAAAARAGCVILLKGPATVIAAPDGRCVISAAAYERAAPWLATAGSGDVLAGFVAGLLARGFAPFGAAETAGWLHVEAARSFGPGLIAEDLPEALPAVFRALGV